MIKIIATDSIRVMRSGAQINALMLLESSNTYFLSLVSLLDIYALALYELSTVTGEVCFEA